MKPVAFSKLSGTGNDFIIIDNRSRVVAESEMSGLTRRLCRRALSVGADGVIFVESHPERDFAWKYFNADGGEAEMCGNGARCVARFAFAKGIAGTGMSFSTKAGAIRAEIIDERRVKVLLTGAHDYRPLELNLDGDKLNGYFLNTGVPHVVIPTESVEGVDVVGLGYRIRHAAEFAPAGANANFVQVSGERELLIRTYERGVEGETLACGTGCVAAAVVMVANKRVRPPVSLRVRSGEKLIVDISQNDPFGGELWLEGPTLWIYDGVLKDEALGRELS